MAKTTRVGTVNVTAGSLTVTGVDTSWETNLVSSGIFSCLGQSIPIESVESDTSLTLSYGFTGPTATGQKYAIWLETSDQANVVEASQRLLDITTRLQSGSFLALNGQGRASDRAQYDDEPAGFVFGRGGDIPGIQISIKLSDATADWSGWQSLQGATGTQGLPGDDGADGIGNNYDTGLQIPGPPAPGELFLDIMARAISYPTNMLGSYAKLAPDNGVAATSASAVFSICKNGVQFATITFAVGATDGVFAGAATSFSPGDFLSIVSPNPANPTLSWVIIKLAGTRL